MKVSGQTRNKHEKPTTNWPNSLGNWASQNSEWIERDDNRVKRKIGTTKITQIHIKNKGFGPEKEQTWETDENSLHLPMENVAILIVPWGSGGTRGTSNDFLRLSLGQNAKNALVAPKGPSCVAVTSITTHKYSSTYPLTLYSLYVCSLIRGIPKKLAVAPPFSKGMIWIAELGEWGGGGLVARRSMTLRRSWKMLGYMYI